MTATPNARSLVLSEMESIALHRVLGLIDEDFPLAGSDVTASGFQSLLARGLIHFSDERYVVSSDVANLLSAYDDPEWSATWIGLQPSGPTIMTSSVGKERAAIRIAESDGRRAFSWAKPSTVLSVVYRACGLEGYARHETPVVVVSEKDVLDQLDRVSFDPIATTFEYAGMEIVEVLSIAIECLRREVAVRSHWVKGANRSFWRYRDHEDSKFGAIEPADSQDLWAWLNSAQYAVRYELEPPNASNAHK